MVSAYNIENIIFNLENDKEMQDVISKMDSVNATETFRNVLYALEWTYFRIDGEKRESARKNLVIFLKSLNCFVMHITVMNLLFPRIGNGIEPWLLNVMSEELSELISDVVF